MKKLIAILTLAAFAFVPSLPAADKCCDKDKAVEKEKGCCPAGLKKGCCPKGGDVAKECPAKAKDKDKAPESK